MTYMTARQFRKSIGKTLEQVSRETGIPKSTLSEIERLTRTASMEHQKCLYRWSGGVINDFAGLGLIKAEIQDRAA